MAIIKRFIGNCTKILNYPKLYNFFTRLIAAQAARRFFVSNHIPLKKGIKILDIGCGTADILEFLPNSKYYGFDINKKYIEKAKLRWQERAFFWTQEVNPSVLDLFPSNFFDIVLAIGVLHHLDDEECQMLLKIAHDLLKKGGKLVTFDGCYIPNQSNIIKFFLKLDRGKFVRSIDGYVCLASQKFENPKTKIYSDLLYIPYTHLVMECIKR